MHAERELTGPVDLCVGRRLSPEARGWARHPMLRANLRRAWGRKKRWDYWCVITPDVVASMVYADVDYAGIAGCWVLDRRQGLASAANVLRPFGRGFDVPELVCTGRVSIDDAALTLSIEEAHDSTVLRAAAPSSAGPISIDVRVAKPAGHESLNVVIPWSDRHFQFTSKQNTRPAVGAVSVGSSRWEVGGDRAFAVQDLGRGVWPYAIEWNWGAGSGRSVDGRLIGLQFGGKWTEGTGSTENALCIDGRLSKIHDELEWIYSWEDPMQPWRVLGERVDLTLTPTFDRYDKTDLKLLKMEVHQCFGTWSGTIHDDDSTPITIAGVDGFAEEARNRW